MTVRPVFRLVVLFACGLMAGCAGLGGWQADAGPQHMPVNFVGEPRLPSEIRRVVLLPVYGGELVEPETAAALDPVFVAALQNRMRFEVVTLSRASCRRQFGQEGFSSVAPLPQDFLATLGRVHDADAVLFLDLTTYHDNRPLTLGVRAKLALVAGPRIVWSYDEVLTAADPAVANSVKLHARAGDRSDLPVDLRASALRSPSRFAAYVADTVFGTLPPR